MCQKFFQHPPLPKNHLSDTGNFNNISKKYILKKVSLKFENPKLNIFM